jgi:phage terminase large subunit GpA-like protein
MIEYYDILADILESSRAGISDIKPSEWAEKYRVMNSDTSGMPGRFNYENSPYSREIVDCLAPDHPARIIAVKKGAQIGYSTGVVENGIGWIISQNPGNILFLVGHDDLVKDSMTKIDKMIDSTGIRNLIKSSTKRVRNTKSGDTDTMKEFPGGYMKLGITNHKSLRNISMMYGFIDDYESMKGETEQSGDTSTLIEQRFAAFYKKMKLFYISTPEIHESSNIEIQYQKGDQRKYHIPCPCCNEMIRLEWQIESEVDGRDFGGMKWDVDDNNELILGSVRYECYKCGGQFDDRDKMDWLNRGVWVPTAKPSKPGFYSYHISALYAPTFMKDWTGYVQDWIEAHPIGQPRIESKYKAFVNLVLGDTYKPKTQTISAGELQNRIRPYQPGIVPEKLSIRDGNGKIVLLTCGIDLNGKEDDARLDYEIVAYSETGATYSVYHGSIGTFNRYDKAKRFADRERWTYRRTEHLCVWNSLEALLGQTWMTDTGRKMKVMCTGLDSGYMTDYAYSFHGRTNRMVFLLKGKDEDRFTRANADLPTFRNSREKPGKLFLVESNNTKDILATHMGLKWIEGEDDSQPFGFMNFPTPEKGLYLLNNYFAHFESEEKIFDGNGFRWVKRPGTENHMFDCRLYANVAKDIMLHLIFREADVKNGTWSDYVRMITQQK